MKSLKMETLDLYKNANRKYKMITFLNESEEVISIEPHLIWQDIFTDYYHCTCYIHLEGKEVGWGWINIKERTGQKLDKSFDKRDDFPKQEPANINRAAKVFLI